MAVNWGRDDIVQFFFDHLRRDQQLAEERSGDGESGDGESGSPAPVDPAGDGPDGGGDNDDVGGVGGGLVGVQPAARRAESEDGTASTVSMRMPRSKTTSFMDEIVVAGGEERAGLEPPRRLRGSNDASAHGGMRSLGRVDDPTGDDDRASLPRIRRLLLQVYEAERLHALAVVEAGAEAAAAVEAEAAAACGPEEGESSAGAPPQRRSREAKSQIEQLLRAVSSLGDAYVDAGFYRRAAHAYNQAVAMISLYGLDAMYESHLVKKMERVEARFVYDSVAQKTPSRYHYISRNRATLAAIRVDSIAAHENADGRSMTPNAAADAAVADRSNSDDGGDWEADASGDGIGASMGGMTRSLYAIRLCVCVCV